MWGDMYEQIVPMYYNFYDVIRNGKSILIDYIGGVTSSFIPNFSSPFTLLALLFKRSDIPNAVNIIILLKIVLSTVACNYFLDKSLKNWMIFINVSSVLFMDYQHIIYLYM